MDLGYNWSVTVATDSQSDIDHSRHRGHTVASKQVGLRGLWLQEALENRELDLEKVDIAMNPAAVVHTSALPGNRIRELCRLARVYVCCGGEVVVLGTRLLSGSAHGCCLLTSRKMKSRRKC